MSSNKIKTFGVVFRHSSFISISEIFAMSGFANGSIILDEDRNVYYAGQVLSGRIEFALSQPLMFRGEFYFFFLIFAQKVIFEYKCICWCSYYVISYINWYGAEVLNGLSGVLWKCAFCIITTYNIIYKYLFWKQLHN